MDSQAEVERMGGKVRSLDLLLDGVELEQPFAVVATSRNDLV